MSAPVRRTGRDPGPVVAVGSLGGTITMTAPPGADGVVPTAGAQELLDAVPQLRTVAAVRQATLRRSPGASLTVTDLLECLAWARGQVDDGAAGVVLVQGTDTLEESAYLLDLYWDRAEPLVLTGAMRPPAAAGADGPGNLLAAVTAAASPALRQSGAVVVLNDEVHAASRVRKTHSTAVNAFTSPASGPLAVLQEGECVLARRLERGPSLPVPERPRDVRVALLEASLDDDGELVRMAVDGGYDGVVVAAFGVGHVSAAAAEAVSYALRRVPVVVATRTGAGSTATSTYGFPGSERDLWHRGAVPAGWLDPRKARLLLWALLRSGADDGQVRREFERRGGRLTSPPAHGRGQPVRGGPASR